jgi:PKD repeat protein
LIPLYAKFKHTFLVGLFLLLLSPFYTVKAQCPTLYDGLGIPNPAPYWTYCFGTDYNLLINSPDNIGSWTIDWGDGSPIENGPDLIPPASIGHLYPATVDTFIVTFTETGSGCVIQGVVVMEEPTNASIQIPVGGVTQACAPAILDFINSSTDVSETTVFMWDFGDGSPILTFDYTNAGQTISHQYLPGTVNCNTTVTLTAENYCNTLQGGPSTATFNPIQIWDIDDAAIDASDILLCYPDTTVTFTNITDRNCFAQGNIFQRQELWNFGDYWGLGYDSIIGWTPWPPALPYTIAYPGIGSYDVMLVDSSFCGLDTAWITINIVPPPTAAFTLSDDTICTGDPITTVNTSTGGANSFDWNFGDGSGWQTTGPGNQTHTYLAPGDYTITLVANIVGGTASCTDTTTLDIHVLPSPTANIVLDNNNGCDTMTVTFTDASINAVAWLWDFGNTNTSTAQNPPSQFYTTGIYTVTLTVTSINGCTDQTTATVNVFQSPVVAFQPTSVCQNAVAQFTDMSTSSGTDPIISWFWDFDDGNTSTDQNPTNIYTNTGTFDVALTVNTANCSNSDTITVTVEPIPNAAMTPDTTVGCTPLAVNFMNTSTGAINYFWDFGDGSTSTLPNPSHNFVNSGTTDTTFTVIFVASTAFGCTDTVFQNITVYPAATAAFTHNGFPGCAPLVVNFTNNSTGGTGFVWDFGDSNGSTLQNPQHTYINNSLFIDVHTVTLVVTSANGCTDTASQTITVYPTPNFGFTSVPDSGCSPLSVTFPSVVGAVAYQWDFGDGNLGTGPTPTHVYVNATTNDVTYNVELVATSAFGCMDTTYGTVTVYPNPTAQFSTTPSAGCHPFDVTLQNTSLGAVSYHWDYDDFTTSDTLLASHIHTYFNTGTTSSFYDIMLIATTSDGCTDTAVQQIEVYPQVIAAFASDTIGCTPLPVNFTDQSTNAVQWEWDFGDGFFDVVQNPSHTFTNPGNVDSVYTVTLIVTSAEGCTDTITQNITVLPVPNAGFLATPTTQIYPNASIGFNNTSSNGSWQYLWDFGDGNDTMAFDPGTYTYATWGTYTIQLIVFSQFCSDTVTQDVTIIPPVPVADFIGSGEGCEPLTVDFINNSEWETTYLWNFGDGGTSTNEHPTYTYQFAGTYTVSLTVTGPGGTDQLVKIDSVIVHPRAIAQFAVNPTSVYVPTQPVQYYNFSSFADNYQWLFGDGNTSTDENPEHFYTTPGSYDVTLIANNIHNCPDTFMIPNAVLAEVGGEITFPNAFSPNSNGSNGGAYNPNATDNDIFFPVFAGVDDYHLMIFNRWGELIFESFDINIGWDGYYRGELSQQEVYVWKAEVKFTDGRSETFVGDLTLLR